MAPSRSTLLSCDQVLCESCRAQIKEKEPGPSESKDCLAGNVGVQDVQLAEPDEYSAAGPNSEDSAFNGTSSILTEHLNCSSEKVECPKCSQSVATSVAIDHRRFCSGAADPGREVSTAEAPCDVMRVVRDVREGLETLIRRAPGDVHDKDYVTKYVNLLVKRLALLERDCTKGQQDPVGISQKGKFASTMDLLLFAATPCRAASKPDVFITMVKFSKIYTKLQSLAKDQKAIMTNDLDVLGGYSFQLECVVHMDTNGEVSVYFTLALGDGPWDDRLCWPFARQVTVIVTHRTDSERDIRLPVSLSDYEMVKKPAPGTWNEGNTTGTVSWKDVELFGFVDDGSIYVNVELA